MDFHTHRCILGILAEMGEDISGGKKHKGTKTPGEYLSFFAELKAVCRKYDFRQTHYGKILERLTTMLEKAARKGHFPVKKELRQCEEMLGELAAGLKKEKNVKKGIVFLPYQASMLPEADQKRLEKGIHVDSLSELYELVEDYLS